ncbi:MAG: GntR family transcriptional regulator [Chthoniobacterales bacterium]|nr:GntR family transcriptional regulator [Chthoniobacterales bacterium]
MAVRKKEKTKTHVIYDVLRREIEAGVWKKGDKLPSDLELSERFGCSVGTVNRAMTSLAHEGRVDRRMRVGSRVLDAGESGGGNALHLDAVACIYSSKRHEGIWRMVQEFQMAADAVGQRAILLSTGLDFRKEAEIIGRLSEFDVKGALLIPTVSNAQEQVYYSQMLASCKFPVVVADSAFTGLGASHVYHDAFHAGRCAAQHLLERGVRRAGFVANNAGTALTRDFYQGYLCALEDAGIEVQPADVQRTMYMRPDFEDPLAESRLLVRAFLEKSPDIEGIVCGSDFMAIACADVAEEMGLSVPGDLKITGCDDFRIAANHRPAMTTYHVPFEEIGRQSFSLLTRMMRGEARAEEEVRLRGTLIARESTGGPA